MSGGHFQGAAGERSGQRGKIDHYKVSRVIQSDDYYPFGLTIAGTEYQRIGVKENRYLYNGKELQSILDLNSYAFEYRMYYPELGRWWQQDQITKENMSPYSWPTNNPARYIDSLGLDSLQRAKAVEMSNKIVNANHNQSPYCYSSKGNKQTGDKGEAPGESMDCSGLLSNTRKAGSEPNPVDTPLGVKQAEAFFGKNNANGIKQLAASTVELYSVEDVANGNSNLQKGNEVYFNNYSHGGIITNIKRDNKGNVTHITFNHSGSSTGPTQTTIPISGTKDFKIDSFGKWDTSPDY